MSKLNWLRLGGFSVGSLRKKMGMCFPAKYWGLLILGKNTPNEIKWPHGLFQNQRSDLRLHRFCSSSTSHLELLKSDDIKCRPPSPVAQHKWRKLSFQRSVFAFKESEKLANLTHFDQTTTWNHIEKTWKTTCLSCLLCHLLWLDQPGAYLQIQATSSAAMVPAWHRKPCALQGKAFHSPGWTWGRVSWSQSYSCSFSETPLYSKFLWH